MVAAVDGSHMWLQSTGNTDKPVQHIGFFFSISEESNAVVKGVQAGGGLVVCGLQ